MASFEEGSALTDAIAWIVLHGRCPVCKSLLLEPYRSPTGASRSLLEWRYCSEICGMWYAVCERTTVPHLIIASPPLEAIAEATLSTADVVLLFPKMVLYERGQCGKRGHDIAVDLN